METTFFRLIIVSTGILLTLGPYLYYREELAYFGITGLQSDQELREIRLSEEKLVSQGNSSQDIRLVNGTHSKQQTPVEEVIVIRNGTGILEWIPTGRSAFEKCTNLNQHQSCSYEPTNDQNGMYEADAVLFRAFHVKQDSYMPAKRNENQTWIFFETESPFRTWNSFRWYNVTIWDQMNLTVTYAPDSDITYEMYGVTCSKTTKNLEPKNYALSKKNIALWAVSDCLSSGRMAYVKELQKHYPVDIYGKCNKKLLCGGHFAINKDCSNPFFEKYKFYLAFENSYCKSYYKEKAVKTMPLETIPVVLGLPNYTEILGEGTHINVRDFKSPKELADHLHKLSADDNAYNEIMHKKLQMKCTSNYKHTNMLCDMCKELHDRKGQQSTLPDMRKVWGVKENCANPREFFKEIDGGLWVNLKSAQCTKCTE